MRAHICKAHACSFVYVCCGRQKLTPGTIPYWFPHYRLETESLLKLKLIIVSTRIVDQTILWFTYLWSPQPVLGLKTPGSTCLGSLPVTAGAAGHAARGKFNVGVWVQKSVPHACSVSTFTPSHLFRPTMAWTTLGMVPIGLGIGHTMHMLACGSGLGPRYCKKLEHLAIGLFVHKIY